ncbi:hypothetical protein FQN54_000342 [Arachnomyces sp. PD_36]|nr:hypothetical protein FQN54_000342 [Arachnomyces sp. PD_36]
MVSNCPPSEEPSPSRALSPTTPVSQASDTPDPSPSGDSDGPELFSPSESSSSDEFLSLPSSPLPETDSRTLFLKTSSPVSRRYSIPRSTSIGHTKKLRSPDRFVPPRDTHSKPFRLSKAPYLLSKGERLFRKRDDSADPFTPLTGTPVGLSRRNTVPERRFSPRQISAGTIWSVGGPSAAGSPPAGIPDGHGGLLGSGTSAPMYLAKFIAADNPQKDLERHESRLALALDIDQASRVLNISNPDPPADVSPSSPQYGKQSPFTWKDNTWARSESAAPGPKAVPKPTQYPVPSTPFRVLDAPLLRDDFYCTTLAYSYTARTLAVGLSNRVYLWSELNGVQHPPLTSEDPANHVTSLSFSSRQGGRSILAIGRQGGQLSLWSTFDSDVRFEIRQPNPVSCVSFKQNTTRRPSGRCRGSQVETEDLAVGDDLGNIWYYSIEWVDESKERNISHWNGGVSLLAKISAHTQQICGLSWSPDGTYLASGGNDNACLLYELSDILRPSEVLQAPGVQQSSPNQTPHLQNPRGFSRFTYHTHLSRIFERYHRLNRAAQNTISRPATPNPGTLVTDAISLISLNGQTALISLDRQKHRFVHSAAVKAIAFAPWQPSLLATGGGSNDRCIHFYHTHSGSCLATINVHAQVTSLIWSRTRREIAATFGYAQPEHPFRIAVFSWPSCEQVVGIPWDSNADGRFGPTGGGPNDCGRALWAISYPGGPNDAVMESESAHPHANSSSDSAILPLTPTSRTVTPSRTPGPPTPAEPAGDTSPPTPQLPPTPRSPDKEGGTWWSRTAEEGCIIVASSDETVKFHEVWSGARKNTAGGSGLLGGSDILEELEGIEKEGKEVIR